jgi:MFS family permease
MMRLRPIVYLLLAANSLVAVVRFMALPFLALYLHRALHASLALSGLVVGLAALSGLLSGFILGPLSDRIGRAPALVISTGWLGLVFLGDGIAKSLAAFVVLQILAGMGFALEGPAFSALLTDLTPEPLRPRVFGYSYWGVNVGAAVGPVLGTLAGAGQSGLPFLLAGAVMLPMSALVGWGLPRTLRSPHGSGAALNLRRNLAELSEAARHPVMARFLVGQLLGSLAYVQLETTLGQYVGSHTALGARLFGYMMSANGLTVILLQPFATRWSARRPLVWLTSAGSAVMGVASILYGLARAPVSWIATHVFLTTGEVLQAPAGQAVVSVLAPPERRATYFTLQGLTYGVAGFLGPGLGGLALATGGKWALFVAMGLANFGAACLYWRGLRQDLRFTHPDASLIG